jgi:hypothetical protein
MSTRLALAPDAAMALGIASTAMPFARTAEDEAERWLRILRMHGEAGIALQALGVSEGPLEGVAGSASPHASPGPAGPPSAAPAGSPSSGHTGPPPPDPAGPPSAGAADDRDAITQVTEQALEIADGRGATGVGTRDLLVAVMRIYGEDFDRVLRTHGTDRDEVLERLATGPRASVADDPHS